MTRRFFIVENRAAKEWATGLFERLRSNSSNEPGWLSKEGGRRATIANLKIFAMTGAPQMAAIIQYADEGWGLADQALRELFAAFLELKQELPPPLADYMHNLALHGTPPRTTGPQKADKWLRNLAVAYAVEELVERFGLPTKGKGSACAIVGSAMKGSGGQILTTKAVERIWIDWSRWLKPLGVAEQIQ